MFRVIIVKCICVLLLIHFSLLVPSLQIPHISPCLIDLRLLHIMLCCVHMGVLVELILLARSICSHMFTVGLFSTH